VKFNSLQNTCSNICKSEQLRQKQKQKDLNLKLVTIKANDVKTQKALTQAVFNKMRKLEEFLWFLEKGVEPYCISCGKTDMDWCCGHFKTVGAQSVLRFDRINTYLQCNRYCNMALSGNIGGNKTTVGYRAGLVIRFGELEGGKIISYCEEKTAPIKITGPELIDMRKGFNIKIKELKERLEL
jgi:Cdc6-like AAA superfamily ATPase